MVLSSETSRGKKHIHGISALGLFFCHLSFSGLFFLALLLILQLSMGHLNLAFGQYRWQDEMGGWHVSDDITKVPAAIRNQMKQNLKATYEKAEKNFNIFIYLGFQPFSPQENVIIRRNDFLVVTDFLEQGSLDKNRSYTRISFNCLYFNENKTFTNFDLSSLYFLTDTCKNISHDARQIADYQNWKKAREEGLFWSGPSDTEETTDGQSPEKEKNENGSQKWRLLFYSSGFMH